jgi:copper transporter 1
MLFTWSTKDLCIVFEGWRITGTGSLILSLLAIVMLTAAYEAVREISRRYDIYAQKVTAGRRDGDDLSSECPSSYIYKWRWSTAHASMNARA